MRITINDVGRREFYEEVLYVASNYKKFQKDPMKKVKGFTKSILTPTILYIVMVVLMLLLFWKDRDPIFLVLGGLLVAIVIFLFVFVGKASKQIDEMMADKATRYVDINEGSVVFTDGKKTIDLKWQNIMSVILGPHVIIFLPDSTDGVLINLDREYEGQVVEAIRAAGHGDLIVERK